MVKLVFLFFFGFVSILLYADESEFIIDNEFGFYVNASTLGKQPLGGDTIWISSDRTKSFKFMNLLGDSIHPIVVINKGGQVDINDTQWGGIIFENCRYVKISGAGYPGFKYGFRLKARQCGLAFTELSSDCEAEYIHIDHEGFFGIYAKKDYGGFPPLPVPIFKNLNIHDCLIENVTEGMYLGETKTPGMEFTNVKIYNNIVRNTGRESVQIANMTDSVEIYNNTFLNGGLDAEYAQNNLLQIGANSSAKVFDNILIGAGGWGIISFGNGNNKYTRNYISDTRGIFVDNRIGNRIADTIVIADNFIKNTLYDFVIKSLNELNFHSIVNNEYNSVIPLFNESYHDESQFYLSSNSVETIETIEFVNIDSLDFAVVAGISEKYEGLGAPGGPIYFQYVEPELDSDYESNQIILTADMIVDEVDGGSIYSSLLLIDEQSLSPENDEHPTSNSWKPAYNMTDGPYHVYFDLKHLYHISQLAIHDMNNVKNLAISVGEPGNWVELFVEPCNSYKKWKIHEINVESRYIRLSMNESVFAAVNELEIMGYPVESQIVLDESMIVDEVDGGSYYSAAYLVDEQVSFPEMNIHPESQSWKPYWNMDKGPYSVVIDLGQDYQLSKIYLHDMHNVANLNVEYGEPNNWNLLFTESCNAFNTWKEHLVTDTTRYLRLSMNESISAAVNEIIIYGTPDQTVDLLKGQEVKSLSVFEFGVDSEIEEGSLRLYPNLITDKLNISLLGDYAQNFRIKIYRLNGKLVYSKNVLDLDDSVLTIDFSRFLRGNYLVRYSNKNGVVETRKIIKN